MKNDFHDHIDRCCKCARNPFDLCVIGAHLLGVVVREERANLDRSTPATSEEKPAAPPVRPT